MDHESASVKSDAENKLDLTNEKKRAVMARFNTRYAELPDGAEDQGRHE